MTRFFLVLREKSGDSQKWINTNFLLYSANRRFFSYTPNKVHVIPNEVRNLIHSEVVTFFFK